MVEFGRLAPGTEEDPRAVSPRPPSGMPQHWGGRATSPRVAESAVSKPPVRGATRRPDREFGSASGPPGLPEDWEGLDWAALERLRRVFLAGAGGREDYWRKERDLESYDATFGQRIAWKWSGVLRELQRRGWEPPAGEVLDWGCGTGVAARAFLAGFASSSTQRLLLWDRSARAREFACRTIRKVHPAMRVEVASGPVNGLLLLSHVLTELDECQLRGVMELVERAEAVIWVEPGTHAVSRSLIGLRERLRARFHMLAPCTHGGVCGLLAPENASHWCHHFVESPPEVFTDGRWARFGRWAEIDLRSLPVSYLVLDRRPPPPLPAGAVRVLGRPRVYKAHALVFACDASGVCEYRLPKRRLPDAFRELKRERFEALQWWRCVAGEVVEMHALEPA